MTALTLEVDACLRQPLAVFIDDPNANVTAGLQREIDGLHFWIDKHFLQLHRATFGKGDDASPTRLAATNRIRSEGVRFCFANFVDKFYADSCTFDWIAGIISNCACDCHAGFEHNCAARRCTRFDFVFSARRRQPLWLMTGMIDRNKDIVFLAGNRDYVVTPLAIGVCSDGITDTQG